MRRITQVKKSIRAISPVIATLLMIAIAVVASLVAYAWVMGYLGGTTSTAGKSINIPSYASSTSNNLIVYVQNVGQGPVQLKQDGAVYVNGDLKNILQCPSGTDVTNPPGQLITIAVGQTAELVIDCPYNPPQKIKVVTIEGTFMETGSGTGTGTGSPTVSPSSSPAPIAANHFTMTAGQPTVNVGQTFGDVLVIAYDSANNVLNPYNGQIYFTATGGSETLPYTATNKYTFSGIGVHTFSGFKFGSPGPKTITVTDGSKSVSTGITVNPVSDLHYSTTMTPTSSQTSATVSYSYTITRDISNDNTIHLGYVNIALPTGFTVNSVTSVTTSTGQTWVSNALSGNPITVHASAAASEIQSTGQSVTVVFTATAPATAGTYGPLLSTAYTSYLGGGSPGQLDGTDPSILVYPVGTLDHFTITGTYPTTVSAGQSFGGIIVTALDGANNVLTGYTGQVYFTSTDTSATLPNLIGSKYTFTTTDQGRHTFTGFALTTAGSQTITVTDGSKAATTIAITVNAAVNGPLHLTIAGAPSSTTAGVSFGGIVVTAYDAYNNVATNYVGQVYFESTDGSPTLPFTTTAKYTFTVADAGTHQFSGFTLRTVGPQTITVRDGSIFATTQSITVTTALDHLAITDFPAFVTEDQTFGGVVVTAYGPGNSILTTYTGNIYFTVSGGTSILPYTSASNSYTFVSGDAGIHTFSGFEFGTQGNMALTATDGTKPSAPVTISVVPTSSLHYSTTMTPLSSSPSTSISYTYTITRQSNSGSAHLGWVNIAVPVGFTGVSVTSVTASNGQTWVANTVSNNVISVHANAATGELSSTGQTVTVVFVATAPTALGTYGPLMSTAYSPFTGGGSPGQLNGNDPSILVYAPGVLDHFAITGAYPTTVSAGQSFGNIIVTAYDIGNNVLTGYTGQIYFTSTDAAAIIPNQIGSKYTFTSADQGVHTFAGFALLTVGTQRITVTNGASAATTNAITVTAAIGGAMHFTITGAPSATTSGISFGGIEVTVYDVYNNLATNYRGQVYFQSTDTSSTLPYTTTAKYTFTATDAGVHQFSGFTLRTLGSQTITVTDGSTSATSSAILVTASLDHFTITGYPTTVTEDQAFGGVVVTAFDSSNNILTGYNGQVYFTSTLLTGSGSATLPYTSGSRYTFVLGDAGAHIFSSFSFSAASTRTITVTDGAKSAISNTITVVAAGALHYSTAMTPLSSVPSASVSYSYTITRASGAHVGWVNIQVPAGFTGVSVTSVTASNSQTWVANAVSNNLITVHANAAAGELSTAGQTVTVVFIATAPATVGTYGPLVSTAYTTYTGTGSPGILDGPNPSIDVFYANTLLLETNFDGNPWDQGWQAGGNPPWYSAVGQGVAGTSAAKSDPVGNNNGPFTSDEMNTLSANKIQITFYYMVRNTDAASDVKMAYSYHANPILTGNSPDFVYVTGGIGRPAQDGVWYQGSLTITRTTTAGAITDPNAFASSFFFRFESYLSTHSDGSQEQIWVDSVLITKSP